MTEINDKLETLFPNIEHKLEFYVNNDLKNVQNIEADIILLD